MKHNILKSLFLATILMAGTTNVWADKGFFGSGQWDVYYWNGSNDKWAGSHNDGSTYDLGIQTTLYLKQGWVKTWSNDNWTQSEVVWYWGWNDNYSNNWKTYKSNVKGDQTWDFDINDYDMIGNAPNNPGHNTLCMYWRLDNYVSSKASYINFTIPGFTTTSASQTFDNTTVGSNSSKTISFGTHYGTALTTSNCSITGTNASEFSVTSINESDVTVQFNPTTAGNKTATLTITDAHSKTCTITLSGKTQYTVTYSKGNYSTENDITDNKVYGTALTLKDKGNFTREHYTQTAWNTNANGTGGTSYALKASYTQEAELQLYPTWTPIEYKITYHNIDGATHTNPANYTIETSTITLQAPTRERYTFEGWYLQSDFSGDKVTQIAQGSTGNLNLYAKWSETKYSVNIYSNNSNYGLTTPSGATWVGPTPVEINAIPHNGYHFTEWKATGGATVTDLNSATTSVTATSTGTVIAHFVESLYDITVQASNNKHGKVTQSATQAGVSTAITITAEPIEGYEFTGWSKTGDITIANINSATTTLTATSDGTVTANFAAKGSTPIYFKANHVWTEKDAWFAVYYWNNNDKKGWSVLNPICGNDYYKAEVPAGCTGFKFVRFRPSTAPGYVSDNNGLNWTNPWNQSSDLVVPTDGKTMFDTKKVYLKPNGNWKTDNARFAAYFYVSSNDSQNKWMSMELTNIEGVYSCDIPTEYEGEKDYNHVIFCRMNPSTTDNNWDNCWNQTNNLQLFSTDAESYDKNCYTIDEGQWGNKENKATGYWSLVSEEPTYNVTLYSSSFGEYGFICNNVQYTSPQSGSITYQVPVNATVKVYSEPYSKEYRGDVMVNQTGDRWEISPDNPLLNITCNTILDDNYKTKGEHEVYLAIPNNGGSWVTNAAKLHYLYAFHDRTDSGEGYAVEMKEVGRATIQLDGNNVEHIYYRCVIPAEVNTIRFEKRTDATTTALQTVDLRYDIPLNDVNCYRLDRKEDTGKYAGVWEQAPGFGGDFRLVHHRASGVTYTSDVIRHGTISQVVSMHIYPIGANDQYPKLELQQRVNGNWVPVDGQTKLVKDINRIMSDKQDQGCGVWNFTITTDGADHATVNFNTPQRYTGNYYIRTNNAEGGWRNYTLSTNHMTFSSYAKNHSGYTHYFCRWIDVIEDSTVPGHNKNVKFIIANDHATVLSNELAGDSHTTAGGDLPESANVRWTWNEVTNKVTRAYILGSHGTTDHIVANGKRLNDQEDWIYEIDITGVTKEQLLDIEATYPHQEINGVTPKTQTFANDLEMIHADAGNSNQYTIRVMYDFKINKTLIMLLPDQEDDAKIGVDVFIERTNQGVKDEEKVTQVTSTVTREDGYTVYSTLKFTKDHLTSTTKTEWERLYYWISFPFDVRISEIFGFGEYGKHWIIQYYDGAERAKNGCWADSPTYWRQITDTTYSARREYDNNGNEDANGNPNNGILVANRGYVLALARNIAKSNIFEHGNSYVRLYFPSREKITSIDAEMQEIESYLRPHTCTITREDRNIYDSNWHIIGVPSYANKEQELTQTDVLYYYTYNTENNTYSVKQTEGDLVQFESMHAYMVQFAGTINWKSWMLKQESQSVAARRHSAQAAEQYALRLELQRDGQYADQTFIQLQAEGATTDYDMNQDLTKIINTGANIYTLAGEKHIQLAGNVLPIAKTTIPVGVQVSQAGTYTIALPNGSDGILATLVDNLTGTHTNLLLDSYTVTLDAGSHENRFYIVLDPDRSATAVENIGADTNEAQKYIIDGQLIIKHDGIKYNVQGEKL